MRSITTLTKNAMAMVTMVVSTGLLLWSCSGTKKIEQKTILVGPESSKGNAVSALYNSDFDDHEYISLELAQLKPILPDDDALVEQIDTSTETIEGISPTSSADNSAVANKIVENYLKSDNKEPDGHCLAVSKRRFERAYREIHGHSPYQDLPDSMATSSFTPKEVFDLLYASASKTDQRWRSLPEKYRGKGNAGAIAYAGMGTLVDTSGIWNGQLRPGALMQVWRFKEDYERVVEGVDVKKIDPYGHSFIFISYVRDEKNSIVGLKIADQGFQSYRPLIPRDYEVWWGVNLSI